MNSTSEALVEGTHPDKFVYEPDEMKLLLEDLCTEAGVKFRLHTRVTAAYCEGTRLSTVVTESTSGREAWRAPVFIDATGDGDLGALAGCQWDIGRPETQAVQPLTMNALAIVKDAAQLEKFISFYSKTPDFKGHVQADEGLQGGDRAGRLRTVPMRCPRCSTFAMTLCSSC